MTFRQELVERAKGRGARILLPEGGDPRVQAAARRLESEGIPAIAFDGDMSIGDGSYLLIPVRVMIDEDDLSEARAIILG